MKWFLLVLIAVFLSSIAPQVSAGGGPVSFEAFTLKPFSETQKFIVAANIQYPGSCVDTDINLSFQDSVAGDEITPFTPPNDSTYVTRHYYTGQVWKEICTKYVQVRSGEKRQRQVIAKAVVAGKDYTLDYTLAFGDDQYSKEIRDFDRYNNQSQIDVTHEKYLGGPKREVGLQWNKVEGADKYSVFIRFGEGTTPYDLAPLTTTTDNKAIVNLNAFEEFYISVNACVPGDPCTKSQQSPWEVLLSKMRNTGNEDAQVISEQPNGALIPTPPSELNPNQDRINQLNQRVADLENKLQASEKKQNILEQKFNELLSFLRSFLPFLR